MIELNPLGKLNFAHLNHFIWFSPCARQITPIWLTCHVPMSNCHFHFQSHFFLAGPPPFLLSHLADGALIDVSTFWKAVYFHSAFFSPSSYFFPTMTWSICQEVSQACDSLWQMECLRIQSSPPPSPNPSRQFLRHLIDTLDMFFFPRKHLVGEP